MAEPGFVTIRNPETGQTFEATPDAFTDIYALRGFELLTAEEEANLSEPLAASEGIVDPLKLSKAELVELATAKGVEGARSMTKVEIAAALGYDISEEE